MFSLGIEFITGSAVMTAAASREEAEWPPHPARIFMALVAAHYETKPLPADDKHEQSSWADERRALEWLEQQGAPSLSCPTISKMQRRTVVKQYVPVNDTTLPRNPAAVKQSEIRAELGVMPSLRSRQERTFPSVSLGLDASDRLVHLIWSNAILPAELAKPFNRLTQKVIRVGHSSSLVHLWIAESETVPQPNLVPQGTHPRKRSPWNFRSIAPGLLAELDQRFNSTEIDLFFDLSETIQTTSGKAKNAAKERFKEHFNEEWRSSLPTPVRLRPVIGFSQAYEEPHGQEIPALKTVFDTELLILAKSDGPVLGLEATNSLMEALRGTLLQGSEPAPEWFSGHRSSGEFSELPHLALLPLPYVGSEYADGHVMGLALAFPRAVSPEERAKQLKRILYDERGLEKELILKLGKLGEWSLLREERSSPPLSLRTETWTGESTVWASVTPVVLDRHPKHDPANPKERQAWRNEVADSIRESCARIGLPAPLVIDVDKTSWHRGSPRSYPGPGGMPWIASKTGTARQQVHVLLQFDQPVQGPVLLGAGRYRGYGLCKPLGLPPQ